jgi:Domain of unknown function (DUF3387)
MPCVASRLGFTQAHDLKQKYINQIKEHFLLVFEKKKTLWRVIWLLQRTESLLSLAKRILRKYGYPPDLQDKAVQTVLQQAEALSGEWAVAK